MATFADSLKKEIARVARKELKSEVTSLRKAVTAHRSEIAALKRDLKSLTSENKALSRQVRAVAVSTAKAEPAPEEARKKPGRQVVYSAERFAAIKDKLGLTQAQLAKLLEVSQLSVYKWLKGDVEPREKQKAKILALRTLGKREVDKLLASAEYS
jgi:DNA-binding transcriptional regulator YiaG